MESDKANSRIKKDQQITNKLKIFVFGLKVDAHLVCNL